MSLTQENLSPDGSQTRGAKGAASHLCHFKVQVRTETKHGQQGLSQQPEEGTLCTERQNFKNGI